MPWGGYGGEWEGFEDDYDFADGRGSYHATFNARPYKPFNPKTDLPAPGNAIHQIQLYRNFNAWVFDDESRNLWAEPFVMGATELIDFHLRRKGMWNAKNPVLQFSLEYIPNADVVLTNTAKHGPRTWDVRQGKFNETVGEPTSGDFEDQYGNKCWLCPAQVRFFGTVPDNIYCIIK